MSQTEENYFVTFNEEGKILSEAHSTLPLARQAGNAHRKSGSFISLTNKKGVKLPL